MKYNIIAILTFISIGFLTAGCHKNDSGNNNNVTPTTPMGKLYFHLHTNVDTNEVGSYGVTYTTSAGKKISVDMAEIYLSHIQLVKPDGSVYEVPNTILLKRLEQEEYFVANVPLGTYKSVKFSVGLDSVTNAKPATADTVLNHQEMQFGGGNGHIFVNFQGNVDTSARGGGGMAPFMYMIGTNSHYQQITMPDHNPVYTVDTTQATYVHIIIDYSKLLDGVQLNNSMNLMVMTPSANRTIVGEQVSNNIQNMFRYEE